MKRSTTAWLMFPFSMYQSHRGVLTHSSGRTKHVVFLWRDVNFMRFGFNSDQFVSNFSLSTFVSRLWNFRWNVDLYVLTVLEGFTGCVWIREVLLSCSPSGCCRSVDGSCRSSYRLLSGPFTIHCSRGDLDWCSGSYLLGIRIIPCGASIEFVSLCAQQWW